MKPDAERKLISINHQFYQTFAAHFSETRGRLQPGVQRILQDIPQDASVLDLGCGNGELASQLVESGFEGQYLGLDFSLELLEHAVDKLGENEHVQFDRADLADPSWDLSLPDHNFDLALAFAVLHHLPGEVLRARLCRQVHGLLKPGGRFTHSNWQFLNSERLRQRIHPWSEVGLADEDVDEGDYLLDWRRGGLGLRYAHHFSADELTRLAGSTGFEVEKTFWSDGSTGDLGLYQVWVASPDMP